MFCLLNEKFISRGRIHDFHFSNIIERTEFLEMGNILNQPVVDKDVTSFTFKGNKGVVVSMQGWRISMEVRVVLRTQK